MTHTPGPWFFNEFLRVIETERGFVLAICRDHCETGYANFRLMAEAPNLLEGLEKIANLEGADGMTDAAFTDLALSIAREKIKKFRPQGPPKLISPSDRLAELEAWRALVTERVELIDSIAVAGDDEPCSLLRRISEISNEILDREARDRAGSQYGDGEP